MAGPRNSGLAVRLPRTTFAPWSTRPSSGLRFSAASFTAGIEEAMRYSLLAGGKRVRPVLALATARALGAGPRAPPAGRFCNRADPHLLADPRRPAGDGRRRAAPRPPDLPRQVRRGRGDPRRRRPLSPRRFRLFCEQPGDPARVLAALRELERGDPALTGWSAASTSTSAKTSWTPGPARPPRPEDGAADRRQRRRRPPPWKGLGDPETGPIRRFADELGVLFQIVDDILDRHGERRATRKSPTEATSDMANHPRQPLRPRAGAPVGSRVPRESNGGAGFGERLHGRPEAGRRLHLHQARMTAKPDDDTEPQDQAAQPRWRGSRARPISTTSTTSSSSRSRRKMRTYIIDVIGEIGGRLRRQPRHLRAGGGAPQPARLPPRQGPLGRRPPGLSAQDPHRPAARACRRSASTAASPPSARSSSPSTTSWWRPRLDLDRLTRSG